MENNKKEMTLIDGVEFAEDDTITSVDLVRIINVFREQENRKELQHYDFVKKIRKELETLNSAGISTDGNISVSEYVDITGRKLSCFKLNRDGMLQMLNSESALVRYKTIEYINYLEEKNRHLIEDNNELYEVAISEEEQVKRQYDADRIKYAINNIETELLACNYTNIEETIDKIINVHTNLYVKDRYKAHQNIDKYGDKGSIKYVNHIRRHIIKKLNAIMFVKSKENILAQTVIMAEIHNLSKDIEVSENISMGKKYAMLEKDYQLLKSDMELEE